MTLVNRVLTALIGAICAFWLIALLRDRVPIDYFGDEAARLLVSYSTSSPSRVISVLTDGSRWAEIHPPGDAAFRGSVNWFVGWAVADTGDLVRFHQVVSWVCVVGGITLIADGIRRRWSTSAAVTMFALAVASSPVVYVGHHVIGEAPAVMFVGVATRWALVIDPGDRRWPWLVGVPLLIASTIRPEAAVVFAGLALIPLIERRWRPAFLTAAVGVIVPVASTVAIELSDNPESYATIRRFPRVSVWDVVSDDRMREIIWGFGVAPFLAVILTGSAAVAWRDRRLSLAPALGIAWFVIAVFFTWQIAIGAVHQQERAYVFPALFGLVAVAAVVGESSDRWRVQHVAPAVAGLLAAFAVVSVNADVYPSWDESVPAEARAVAELVDAPSDPADAILTDWMWWQEWRVGVYASEPGPSATVCNYAICPPASEATVVDTSGLSPDNAHRLEAAASFLRNQRPRHVVVFSEERQAEWDRWSSSQTPFPSFVRPLFTDVGSGCWVADLEFGGERYCTVLTNSNFVVYELAD